MPTAPAADLATSVSLVQALLAAQAPSLAELPVTHLGNGWDNDLYRLGESLLVRLPRRAVAAELTASEARWLPTLSELLTVPVPQPVFVGAPSDDFPWPWSVVSWIAGEPASGVPVAERTAFAEQLADFLWALHVPAHPEAPVNPVRGGSLHREAPDARAHERLELLAQGGAADLADALRPRWAAWASAPDFDGVDVWLHGDLHPHNLVVGRDGLLAAVIDWGDLTAGDPACDLATAWLTFDEAGRRVFRERVDMGGPVDEATWTRAKAWALHLGLTLATQSDDHPALAATGRHALEALATEHV